jgi:hypothetical protein
MNDKGFFLLETVVLGLILFAAAGVFGTYAISSRLRADSENRLTAAFLAQKQLACVQGNATVLKAAAGSIPWQDPASVQPILKNGKEFYIKTDLQNTEDEVLKQVEVVVQWQERGKTCQLKFVKLVKCDG